MLEKILIPLDGSGLAEMALPYVRELASQKEAEVYLLHVCPQEHRSYLHMHQIYLNTIADSLRKEIKEYGNLTGVPSVQAEVIIGDPVKVILDYVKQRSINLVTLTSCGSGGIRPWYMGNIADKVVRVVDAPCLLIRIKREDNLPEGRTPIRRILVPLDSSSPSEIAVPYAVELANKLHASITLFSMAPTIYSHSLDAINSGGGVGLGINWDSVDASTLKAINEYLLSVEDKIRQGGVEVSHTGYTGIDAAYEILKMEKKTQADLVVMATRGRSTIARWAFGSVAEKILKEGDKPILLVRE
jgi:nucleotide-binding universal stress UspA family protein